MDTAILSHVVRLSDQDLVARVKLLAQQEREAIAVLIAHLAVLDERRLYLAEGCSSLFTYCTQILCLSEHTAYGRIEAARTARKFPITLEMLADGSVNLTTVGLLASHLTSENYCELLKAAKHKSKRQVEELVARLRPLPSVPSSIRRLPTASPGSTSATIPETAPDAHSVGGSAAADDSSEIEPGSLSPPTGNLIPGAPAALLARRAVVEPLAPQQYRVQFTASAQMYEKIRLAQDLLRHQIPDGDLAQIMDRALSVLLEALARQKFAATDRPRESHERDSATGHPRDSRRRENVSGRAEGSHRAAAHSRHIPAEVKRRVWLRDAGQCSFVARNGRRCNERGFLEFHHVVPYSAGGEATVDNIELRCRAHNGYEAELCFGGRAASAVKEQPAAYWPSAAQHVQRLRSGMTLPGRVGMTASARPGPT